MGTSRAAGHVFLGVFLAVLLAAPVRGLAASGLDGAAASLSATLAAGLGVRTPAPLVFVIAERCLDPLTGNVFPVAEPFAAAMRKAMAATGAFKVTDDPEAKPDFYLNGYTYREADHVVLGCRLVTLAEGARKDAMDVAAARLELPLAAMEEGWFAPSLKSKTLFLMSKLQERYLEAGGRQGRPRVQVEPFRCQPDNLYSPFADALRGYAQEFLKASNFLAPFTGAQKLLEARARARPGAREIAPALSVPGTMIDLTGADLYLAGTYRPGPESIELTAVLSSADGSVMVADSTGLPAGAVTPALLSRPQTADPGFMAAMAALGRPVESRGLKLEVFTQKGEENVRFAPGEQRVIFFKPSGRAAYVRLFLRGADGGVFQLWPNAFEDGAKPLAAGEVVCLPGPGYAKDFELTVGPTPGGELIFAFASDKPLPEPPHGAGAAHGVFRMDLDPAGLAAYYEGWAKGERARLARDAVPVYTGP